MEGQTGKERTKAMAMDGQNRQAKAIPMTSETMIEGSVFRDDGLPLSDGGAFPRGAVSVIHAPSGRSKTTLCAALALPSTSSPATAADRGELAGEEGSMTMAAMCTVRDIRPKHSDDRGEPEAVGLNIRPSLMR